MPKLLSRINYLYRFIYKFNIYQKKVSIRFTKDVKFND